MTKPVEPAARAPSPRRAGRRVTDPAVAADPDEPADVARSNLPVVAGPLVQHEPVAAGAVDAQILGQDGVKRGLRGGQPVLDQARQAYLNREYSGAADRRPRRGVFTKTEL